MKLRLWYLPDGENPIDTGPANQDMVGWNEWLTRMANDNPEIIFYFTIDSTDIFEDEDEVEEPKCVCLEFGNSCGGPERAFCSPRCLVCL